MKVLWSTVIVSGCVLALAACGGIERRSAPGLSLNAPAVEHAAAQCNRH